VFFFSFPVYLRRVKKKRAFFWQCNARIGTKKKRRPASLFPGKEKIDIDQDHFANFLFFFLHDKTSRTRVSREEEKKKRRHENKITDVITSQAKQEPMHRDENV